MFLLSATIMTRTLIFNLMLAMLDNRLTSATQSHIISEGKLLQVKSRLNILIFPLHVLMTQKFKHSTHPQYNY